MDENVSHAISHEVIEDYDVSFVILENLMKQHVQVTLTRMKPLYSAKKHEASLEHYNFTNIFCYNNHSTTQFSLPRYRNYEYNEKLLLHSIIAISIEI